MTDTPTFFPDLQTERLLLRLLTLEDTDFIFQHFSNPQVTRYLVDEPPLANVEEAQAIIEFFLEPENKTHNRWGIVRKTDNKLIGTCGFHKWQKSSFRSEIGYDLSPDCWGKGYMTEALQALIQNGFERMKLNRIDALIYVENPRSFQLLEKLGFKQEGILRDYFFFNEIFYDHYIYSLLRCEWQG